MKPGLNLLDRKTLGRRRVDRAGRYGILQQRQIGIDGHMTDIILCDMAGIGDGPLLNDDMDGRVISFPLEILQQDCLLERVEGRIDKSCHDRVLDGEEIRSRKIIIAVVPEDTDQAI